MKNLYALFLAILTFNCFAQQNTTFKFNELVALRNKEDFPADAFSLFQKKGLEFIKKINFNELLEGDYDLSHCNRYTYSSRNCSVHTDFCEGFTKFPLEEYSIRITLGFGSNENYDQLVQSIKANCKFLKMEDSEYNNLPVKTYYYKHISGAIFNYHKYFSKDNTVEYYVTMDIK